jgi:transcriptional regulator with PAS, ATPase and Fis domain
MNFTQPQYFHLVWDHELDQLRDVFETLRHRRDQILRHWYDLYVVHLGETRSLSQPQFVEIFGWELESTADDLLRKDMAAFTGHVRELGERLFERGVPFSEVVISLHLFEEAVMTTSAAFSHNTLGAYQSFDKLGHCRAVILAEGYFRSHTARDETRIDELETEAAQLPPASRSRFHGLVGASPAMHQLYARIEAAGKVMATVLVVGESGTGKELVARAIHECGPNRKAPFVALNCAALPRDLIESELFGYKRGAFTGARSEYLGLFRAADGGTLFLDEITEMSPETQSKLLRALQERTVRPVGSTRELRVNARLIASTNRDPEQAVRSAQLRQDLYYRLQANVLRVPPLRDHVDDVPLLAQHFVTLFNDRLDRASPVLGVADDAIEAMKRYPWPGNVRELSNAIENAFTFGNSQLVHCSDLPPRVLGTQTTPPSVPQHSPAASEHLTTFAEVEKNLIRRALGAAAGNKSRAARLLGISRKKLYAKIAKYELD